MTENTASARPFYVVTAASGIHAGRCLVACGEDVLDGGSRPPVRGAQRLRRFASRADAVDAHPQWEEEIMTS
jgi:hypothetical protein